MTCPDCTAAATHALWPGYRAGCRQCSVRALASGLEFFESKTAGELTPAYRAALAVLVDEDWQAAHKEVKAEFSRIQKLKGGS